MIMDLELNFFFIKKYIIGIIGIIRVIIVIDNKMFVPDSET